MSRAARRRARARPARPPARRARPGAAARARSAAPASTAARPTARRARRARAAAATSATSSANGLSSRCLRERSAATASGVVGAAGEVVAAEALDRDDRAVAQQRGGRRHRVGGAGHGAGPISVGPRAARRAGVRLRVEAPVARVLVLRPAGGAHLEARHRRERTVVGDAAHDREPRPAVRAVDERVAVAAVAGVPQLGQAVRARRGVGRHERVGAAVTLAGDDLEARAVSSGSTGSAVTRSTCASGGASARTRSQERRRRRRPCPRPRARRRARRCRRSRRAASSSASRKTNGRKPTPCTVPSTRTRERQRSPGATITSPPPARAARARRSPAPPGCAGCAPSA